MNSFLELNDSNKNNIKLFDDVEIIVDPKLEDESNIDINKYLNNFIFKCRICGNLFPSKDVLEDNSECPICNSQSPNGFIFKGKLLNKKEKDDASEDKQDAIDELITVDLSDE